MVLDNTNIADAIHVQFLDDNASIRFEIKTSTNGGSTLILGYLLADRPTNIASTDAANSYNNPIF